MTKIASTTSKRRVSPRKSPLDAIAANDFLKELQRGKTENSSADAIAANDIERKGNCILSPAHEEIAQLAYSYWEMRCFQGVSPEEDWFRAEQELQAKPPKTEV